MLISCLHASCYIPMAYPFFIWKKKEKPYLYGIVLKRVNILVAKKFSSFSICCYRRDEGTERRTLQVEGLN